MITHSSVVMLERILLGTFLAALSCGEPADDKCSYRINVDDDILCPGDNRIAIDDDGNGCIDRCAYVDGDSGVDTSVDMSSICDGDYLFCDDFRSDLGYWVIDTTERNYTAETSSNGLLLSNARIEREIPLSSGSYSIEFRWKVDSNDAHTHFRLIALQPEADHPFGFLGVVFQATNYYNDVVYMGNAALQGDSTDTDITSWHTTRFNVTTSGMINAYLDELAVTAYEIYDFSHYSSLRLRFGSSEGLLSVDYISVRDN